MGSGRASRIRSSERRFQSATAIPLKSAELSTSRTTRSLEGCDEPGSSDASGTGDRSVKSTGVGRFLMVAWRAVG